MEAPLHPWARLSAPEPPGLRGLRRAQPADPSAPVAAASTPHRARRSAGAHGGTEPAPSARPAAGTRPGAAGSALPAAPGPRRLPHSRGFFPRLPSCALSLAVVDQTARGPGREERQQDSLPGPSVCPECKSQRRARSRGARGRERHTPELRRRDLSNDAGGCSPTHSPASPGTAAPARPPPGPRERELAWRHSACPQGVYASCISDTLVAVGMCGGAWPCPSHGCRGRPGQWAGALPPAGGWVRGLRAVERPKEHSVRTLSFTMLPASPPAHRTSGPVEARFWDLRARPHGPEERAIGPALALPEPRPPPRPLAQEGTFLCGPVMGWPCHKPHPALLGQGRDYWPLWSPPPAVLFTLEPRPLPPNVLGTRHRHVLGSLQTFPEPRLNRPPGKKLLVPHPT